MTEKTKPTSKTKFTSQQEATIRRCSEATCDTMFLAMKTTGILRTTDPVEKTGVLNGIINFTVAVARGAGTDRGSILEAVIRSWDFADKMEHEEEADDAAKN